MTSIGRSAIEVAEQVRAGRLTAAEVVAEHCDAIERLDGRLGAFVSTRRQAALSEAAACQARDDLDSLPLAGVPVAIKDEIDVAGEVTRRGSLAFPEQPAPADDPVVARLRAAGAIVVGKTRPPEMMLWGTSDGPDGTAVSPWDTSRTAGGSSGGSAAAVAAGLVPIAHGADGIGSVRIPSAACGLFGIKPAGDVAPVEVQGRRALFGMTQHGPLATTVADAALVLDVIADTDRWREVQPPAGPLRVAVSVRSPAAGVAVRRAWRETALEAGRLLRTAGHHVAIADPPYRVARDSYAVFARWTQAVAEDLDTLGADRSALQPRTARHAAIGRAWAKRAPVHAEQVDKVRSGAAAFLGEHDVLVTPTFAAPALASHAWHRKSWAANVLANLTAYPFPGYWNLADCPAAAVPMGLEAGRPVSAQIVAAQGREDLVLAVARQLEQLRPWTRHAPGWAVVH